MNAESSVYLIRQSDVSGFKLSTFLKYLLSNRKKVCGDDL